MIEKKKYKIPKGPYVEIDYLICDFCGVSEALESAFQWYKVDDVRGSAGLNAFFFHTTACISAYYAERATPGE